MEAPGYPLALIAAVIMFLVMLLLPLSIWVGERGARHLDRALEGRGLEPHRSQTGTIFAVLILIVTIVYLIGQWRIVFPDAERAGITVLLCMTFARVTALFPLRCLVGFGALRPAPGYKNFARQFMRAYVGVLLTGALDIVLFLFL
jgi:hypothetical protein